MRKWLREVHAAARSNAEYERYMQDTVHNWQEDVMPGEDAVPAPRWVQALPLVVVHRVYWPLRGWLARLYVVNVLEILWLELMRVAVCNRRGHDLEDTGSWATPDSGGEDLTCKRCRFHFHHTYY